MNVRRLLSVASLSAASLALLSLVVAPVSAEEAKKDDDGFASLFDGKSLDGWKVSENKKSVRIEDGAIVTNGERAHAFYVGDVNGGKFDDFELKLEVMTEKNSNGGVYIHTEYQDEGWPEKGYEIQVNNSFTKDPRKTGSLYAIEDITEDLFKDGEWMHYHIKVVDKTITISINGKKLVEYTEPENPERPDSMKARLLIPGGGTIAFQAHDPGSTVHYRNIRIKPLK